MALTFTGLTHHLKAASWFNNTAEQSIENSVITPVRKPHLKRMVFL